MQRSLLLSLVSNWVGMAATIVVGLILTPFIVRSLGAEQYGLFVLMVTCASQISFLDLGLKTTVTSLTAQYKTQEDTRHLSGLITAVSIVLAILALCGLLFLLFVNINIGSWFSVPPSLVWLAQITFLIISIEAAFQLATGSFEAILAGYERYDYINAVNVLRVLVNAALVVLVLSTGGGLIEIATVLLMARILQRIILAWRSARIIGQAGFSVSSLNRDAFSILWRFGFWASVLLVTGRVVSQIDNIVVGALSGATAVALYAIPLSLVEQVRLLASNANTILIPRFNHLSAAALRHQCESLVLKWSRFNQIGALAICVPLAVTGGDFIDLWMGAGFGPSHAILIMLILPYFIILPGMVLTNYLYALNRHAISAKLRVWEAFFNLGLSIVFGYLYGPIGVAFGTLFPAIIFRGCLLPRAVSKIADLPLSKFIDIAIVSCLPLAIFHFSLLWVLRETFGAHTWGTFLLVNSIGVTIFSGIVYRFYLDADDRAYLMRRLRVSKNHSPSV